VAAVPPDVRKGYAFPVRACFSIGLRPGLSPKMIQTGIGKPEAFRTSGGRAEIYGFMKPCILNHSAQRCGQVARIGSFRPSPNPCGPCS